MRKKRILFIITPAALLAVLLYLSMGPFLTNNLLNAPPAQPYQIDPGIKSIYSTDFELSKLSGGKLNVYLPRYTVADESTATYYSGIFNMTENPIETEEYYSYTNNTATLTVYKHVSKVLYETGLTADPKAPQEISDTEAIDIARQHYDNNLLNLNYEEALVEYEDGVFFIAFIGRLGNLKNFGFTNNVRLDGSGNIISLEYFYISYEKLNSFATKTMRDAYNELPINFSKGVQINLNTCQIVYIYENSIVQPAYYFQGVLNDGRFFESFVQAAIYE